MSTLQSHFTIKTRAVCGIALLFSLWQILFALLLTPNVGGLAAKYNKLNEWDSDHYTRIVDQGYSMPEGRPWVRDDIHSGAANLMFFPGYPLASRYFKMATGLSTRLSLLLVSQLACWAFWTYLLLILLNAGVSRRGLQVAVFLVLIHPAAFYLVMGYTESTFLAALLGFIYWSDRLARKDMGRPERVLSWFIAAAHGFVMSFTRIVSFAAAPYPAIVKHSVSKDLLCGTSKNPVKSWKRFGPPVSYIAPLALGVFAICGAGFYFVFLQQRFGHWDLYFKLEEIGWGNHRQWLAIINPLSYIPRFFFEDTRSSINRLSNLSIVLFFVTMWKQEKRRQKKYNDTLKRFGLYFTAFFLYYIPITGKAAAEMDSMVRYNLPSYILLSLCLGMILPEQTGSFFRDPTTKKILWGRALGAFVVFAIQVSNVYRFLRGGWIA